MLLEKKPTTSLFIHNFPNADLNAHGNVLINFLSELSNHALACILIYDLKILTAIRCYCTK